MLTLKDLHKDGLYASLSDGEVFAYSSTHKDEYVLGSIPNRSTTKCYITPIQEFLSTYCKVIPTDLDVSKSLYYNDVSDMRLIDGVTFLCMKDFGCYISLPNGERKTVQSKYLTDSADKALANWRTLYDEGIIVFRRQT